MIGFRAGAELTAAIDAAASEQADHPSRSEMIRRIVTEWLHNKNHVIEPSRNSPPRRSRPKRDGTGD